MVLTLNLHVFLYLFAYLGQMLLYINVMAQDQQDDTSLGAQNQLYTGKIPWIWASPEFIGTLGELRQFHLSHPAAFNTACFFSL